MARIWLKTKRDPVPAKGLGRRPVPGDKVVESPRESIANETYFVCRSPDSGCYVYQYEVEGDLRTVFLHAYETQEMAQAAIEGLARKGAIPPGDRLETVKVDLWDAIQIVEAYPVTPRQGSLVIGIYCQYEKPIGDRLGMVHYFLDGEWYIGDPVRDDIFRVPKGK